MLCCTKNYVVLTKKYFTEKLRCPPKLSESQKNILCQQKKLCDTKKRDYMLTKKVHVVYKHMLY